MLNEMVKPTIIGQKVNIGKRFVDKENGSNKIIVHNKKMKELIKYVNQIANLDSNVLILGETGTGKDLFARRIYEASKRKALIGSINCVSIPEELLVSQLLRYINCNASKGTLFLNEIADFSPELQAKVLCIMKEADLRIIASSNKKLHEMVKEGSFREDLYNFLNEVQIYIPPLRERPEDIKPLIYHSLNKFNKKYNVRRHISQRCIEILSRHRWPGNVRELENIIESLVVTSEDNFIKQWDIPKRYR